MIQALLYCIALLLLEYSLQLLRNVCRPLKMSVFFRCLLFPSRQAPGKSGGHHRVSPQGRYEGVGADRRQDGDGGGDLLRQQAVSPQHADPGADHQTHWGAEPPRCPVRPEQDRPEAARRHDQGHLLWVCVCVFVIDGVRIPACGFVFSLCVSLITSNGFCTAWCVTGLLLVQFIRWLYWLRSDHRRSHPLRGDEARPGGLELRELQRDLPRNLPQLQRRALLSNGATPESAGTNRRHRCSLWAYRTGAPVETQTSKWWSSCWCPLCVSRLWSWSKPPRSTRSHWPLEMELMMSAWSSRPTLASVSPRYLPVKWPHINTVHNLLSLYLQPHCPQCVRDNRTS